MENNIKNELINYLNTNNYIEFNENEYLNIKIKNTINKTDLIAFLSKLYEFETKLSLENKNNVILNIKDLDLELLVELFKFSFKYNDLCDATVLLNIINLIKIYNSLDDSFFNDERICVSSIDMLLDLKLELQDELKDFQKQLSIYFISLFKSYNKLVYTPLDSSIDLPIIYKNIFMSTDLLTLSGIFSVSEDFSTQECVYINNALEIIFSLHEKTLVSTALMNDFLKGINNDYCTK